jgi:chain length determinant protein tyrosine kinase EpsG
MRVSSSPVTSLLQAVASERPAKVTVVDRCIGEIIRSVRPLSDQQIEQVVAYQRERGVRFGEASVALGLTTDDDVLWALSQQFHYPYVPEERRQQNPELIVASDPFGEQAEVFRDLCNQIAMTAAEPGRPRRAYAVVSPDSGDGKTFMAANLAAAFSQIGGRTVLVDADMRSPRQHEIFGIEGASGLSSILAGRTELDVVHSVPSLPSMFVIPVGTVPPNPMELLQRPAFGLLMQELLSKFDHVVVDTPALSRGADARVIAARCGAAIAVGRKGATSMSAIGRLIDGLGAGRTQLIGVVLNEH